MLWRTYRASGAVVWFLNDVIEDNIFNEYSNGFQDEGHKQVHVNIIPCAMKFPENKSKELNMIQT